MDRRDLLTTAIMAGAAAGTAGLVGAAEAVAQDRGRWRYRRRRGYRTGLLLKDVTGDASFGRRAGEFEGDCLIQGFHYGRVLHASGLLRGEAEIDRRRRDFEIDIDDRFRRVGVDLSERRGRVTLDLGEVEVLDLGRRELEVDLDAVRLHDIRGPHGDHLEELLARLAEALADEGGYRKAKGRDDDIEELVEAINRLLARYLFVVEPDRRRHD
jgi:hypothetical protein